MDNSRFMIVVFFYGESNIGPMTAAVWVKVMQNVSILLSMRGLHRPIVQIYSVVALCFCLVGGLLGQSEIVHTRSFTKKLQRASLEYLEPVEQYLHVVPLQRDEFMQYDLVLEDDRGEFEMRFRIRRINKHWRQIPQHVEIGRLVASMATNMDDADIAMEFPDPEFLRMHFNADEGLFAHFQPKASFSDKPHGTLVSLFAQDKAVVDVVLLYRDPQFIPVEQFRNVRFTAVVDRQQ